MWRDIVWRLAATLSVLVPWLLPARALTDIALSTIAALFVLHSYMERDFRWCKEGWVRILTALWMLMIARSLFAPHMGEALARALPFMRYFIFAAALARWTLANARIRHLFMLSLSTVVLVWAIDGLLQRILGTDILLHALLRDPLGGHVRLSGVFGKPMLGIMLAWLCFPACLFLLQPQSTMLRDLTGWQWCLRLGACAMVFLVIALSGERMALLLTLLGIGMLAFLLPFKKRYILCVLACCVIIVGGLALLSPMFFNREIASTFSTFANWQQSPYGALLASDMRLAELHPLLGIGPNQFRFACPELYPSDPVRINAMCNLHPHHIYMEWLIEEGIPGVLLFIAFLGAIMLRVKRSWNPYVPHWALAGFAVAFLLRIWPLASSTSFFSSWGAPPFWLVLGGLIAYSGLQENTVVKTV